MPFGDEPGRLRHVDERQPSEEGAFVRIAARATSSADKRRFFVKGLVLALLAALLLAPAATASPPQRIVSLSPTATEDLFAIGAGPQVVAVDDQSNYPANAPKTKLSGYTPNAEAIAAYKPDLVVLSSNPNGIVPALGKLHIRALVQPPAANLDDAYAQIRRLGAVTGHAARAAAVVKSLRQRVSQVVASVPPSAKGLTFYEELSPDYYSATSKTFTGQVLTLLGLKDIADAADKSGSGYPKLSAEYIVASNPDLVVLADTKCCNQTAAKVKARPGWGSISALTKGGVVGVSDDVASRWGPRIVQFMSAVAQGARAVAAAK
jgi:iron complex transport system substrate-binding protein